MPNYKWFENYCTEEFNGRSYASISIKREIQMNIVKNENDLLIGHVKIAEGSFFIGSVYLNPGEKERRQLTINSLEDSIKEIRTKYRNPKIAIFGDFNIDLKKFNWKWPKKMINQLKEICKRMEVSAPDWTFIHRGIKDWNFRNDWCLYKNIPIETETHQSSIKVSDHLLLRNKLKISKEIKKSKQGKKLITVLPDKKTSRKITEATLKKEFPTISSLNDEIMKNQKN